MEQPLGSANAPASLEADSDLNLPRPTTEKICGQIESLAQDARGTLKHLAAALDKLERSARSGEFHAIRETCALFRDLSGRLNSVAETATEAAGFDLLAALSSGAYLSEVLEAANAIGLAVQHRGNLLFCFPQIVRVLPEDGAVLIGKKRDYRLRPSELARRLQKDQRKPLRLKSQQFLQLLYKAYLLSLPAELPKTPSGFVVGLTRIYDLLTIFPGTSKEYSIEEFSRDVYLLDKAGIITTKDNIVLSFSASSGTRTTADTLIVVTETGAEIAYYGISFMDASTRR